MPDWCFEGTMNPSSSFSSLFPENGEVDRWWRKGKATRESLAFPMSESQCVPSQKQRAAVRLAPGPREVIRVKT